MPQVGGDFIIVFIVLHICGGSTTFQPGSNHLGVSPHLLSWGRHTGKLRDPPTPAVPRPPPKGGRAPAGDATAPGASLTFIHTLTAFRWPYLPPAPPPTGLNSRKGPTGSGLQPQRPHLRPRRTWWRREEPQAAAAAEQRGEERGGSLRPAELRREDRGAAPAHAARVTRPLPGGSAGGAMRMRGR